jgi:hypothetical protein
MSVTHLQLNCHRSRDLFSSSWCVISRSSSYNTGHALICPGSRWGQLLGRGQGSSWVKVGLRGFGRNQAELSRSHVWKDILGRGEDRPTEGLSPPSKGRWARTLAGPGTRGYHHIWPGALDWAFLCFPLVIILPSSWAVSDLRVRCGLKKFSVFKDRDKIQCRWELWGNSLDKEKWPEWGGVVGTGFWRNVNIHLHQDSFFMVW